jgi:hypothetical protein
LIAIRRPLKVIASRINELSSDSVRKPCAIVVLYGDSTAARAGSTWIHCESPVAAAN